LFTQQECSHKILTPDGISGEHICKTCGLVIASSRPLNAYTQLSPEWYSNWSEKDSQTLKEWLTILRVVSCQLNIPNFPYREEAARIIRKQAHLLARSQRLSKNKRATVAALMHMILKEYDKKRPLKEIAKDLCVDYKLVMKQAWTLSEVLEIEKENNVIKKDSRSTEYLRKYAGKLTDNKELILQAEKILKMKRSGGNPIGLAAGAFYRVCKMEKADISKEEIGKVFHISGRTVYTNETRIRKLLSTAKINKVIL
jgi:transcription initiation factor TFIIIB Brf1 subunit/transcription initiation factor TFIIB